MQWIFKRRDAIRVANPGWRRRLTVALCGLAVAALSLSASAAHAADRIYWGNDFGQTISWANLDGSGGGNLPIAGAHPNGPMGLAIDSAAGRIYWANWGTPNPDDTGTGTTISWANLDGSGGGELPIVGTSVSGPHGVAVDPAAGKIYWPNVNTDTISYANLDGSGGGVLFDGAATVDQPRGVAIDPATRRIYWANWAEGTGTTISYANLDGSGGGDLMTNGVALEGPEGVALDPGTGRIYWGNFSDQDTISFANLDGTGGADDLDTTGATVDNAHGVAVDPIAGKIYWPNFYAGVISWANLDGSGGGDFPPSAVLGADVNAPDLPVLLETPKGTGAPAASGGSKPGSTLSCSPGSWAPDLLGSLLYRAPHSFGYQWSLDGADIAGATTSSYSAAIKGGYRCRVTASNAAGSASQTSSAHVISSSAHHGGSASNAFRLGRLTRNESRGTALLTVVVSGRGTLTLADRALVEAHAARWAKTSVSRTVLGAGKVRLPIRAPRKAKRELDRSGEVEVRVKVTFSPTGGRPKSHTRTVKLKEKIRR